MNTIIYVCRSRDDTNFKIEKLDEPDYCLIRLGLPVPLWKHLKQLDKEMQDKQERGTAEGDVVNPDGPAGGCPGTENGTEINVAATVAGKRPGNRIRSKGRKSRILRRKENSLWKHRRVIGRNITRDGLEDVENGFVDAQEILQQEAKKQEVLRKEALRQQVTELLGELESLQTALCLLGGNTYWTYTVYEERLRTGIDTLSWWDAWKIPEFENYSQPLWAEKILPHGEFPDLLILGQSDCIQGLLVTNARRLRSAKWYLLQEEYTEDTETFLDSFYEEYGLVIEVHLLEEKKDWWRVCFCCPEPMKVLDFTGEAKVSAYGVPKGSIWLDLNAMDEKSGRMEVRNQGINYFSLKKLWAQLQKPDNTLTPM